MKILLTGVSGFIGSNFARQAIANGHQIAGLTSDSRKLPADLSTHKNFTALKGNLNQSPWGQIKTFAPEVCVHSAWITTPGIYLESSENFHFFESSLQFLKRVRETGVRHIVALGTCIEYQITNQKLSESITPIAPTTTYARCKNDLRLTLEKDAATDDFILCWPRVFYPYGPGEHPSRLASSIIQKLSRNEPIVLKTPDSAKDYIYIDDLAAALLLVTEKQHSGAINLGTGTATPVRQIAQTLATLLQKTHLITEANPPIPDSLGNITADPTLLNTLGWHAQFNIEQGLKNLVAATNAVT